MQLSKKKEISGLYKSLKLIADVHTLFQWNWASVGRGSVDCKRSARIVHFIYALPYLSFDYVFILVVVEQSCRRKSRDAHELQDKQGSANRDSIMM